MKRFSKFLTLGTVFALIIGVMSVPAFAQDQPEGFGQGGVLIQGNTGGDPNTFIPFIGSDGNSSAIYDTMYPSLVAVDPIELAYQPNQYQAMAAGWEYDETGTVLTMFLREDITWSDGTPITAADYLWAYNAVKSGLTSSPRTSVMYELDNGTQSGGIVHDVVALDDYTLQFTLGSVQTDADGEVITDEDGNPVLNAVCDAFIDIDDITPVPAHIYEARFGDDYASIDADKFFVPRTEDGLAVTWGPLTDPLTEFGVQISMLADENYTDNDLGFVSLSERLTQNVESSTILFERFLAGDFTNTSIPGSDQNGFREGALEDGYTIVEYPRTSVTFMSLNTGDPENPQPGLDEEGNFIDQGSHPVFGDVRVRQAVQFGVDLDAIIGTRPDGDNPETGIVGGNGYRTVANSSPYHTNLDELEALGVVPRTQDQERAMALLEEAGWTDEDGDGVRECNGCLHAEEGAPLEFSLITMSGANDWIAIAETIRAQLSEVGFLVNFEAIEFGTLVVELQAQTTDAVILAFSGFSAPNSPGSIAKTLFFASNDLPGSGFNMVSFQNEEFERLINLADSLPAAEDGSYPACDPDTRDQLYAEAQAILYEESPWVYVYFQNVMAAWQPGVSGMDLNVPFPGADYDTWFNLNPDS